jgi:hypothetical protein
MFVAHGQAGTRNMTVRYELWIKIYIYIYIYIYIGCSLSNI